eukprot:Tbor_TRINITY_DN5745_c0_g2::TRINITY_DN5745_c0_g2_i1::g.19919::m.19919
MLTTFSYTYMRSLNKASIPHSGFLYQHTSLYLHSNNRRIIHVSTSGIMHEIPSPVFSPDLSVHYTLLNAYSTIYNPTIVIDNSSKRLFTDCRSQDVHKIPVPICSTSDGAALANQMAANILLGDTGSTRARGKNNDNRKRQGDAQTNYTEQHLNGDMSSWSGSLPSYFSSPVGVKQPIHNSQVSSPISSIDSDTPGQTYTPSLSDRIRQQVTGSVTTQSLLSEEEVFVMAPSYTEVEGERDAKLAIQRIESERKKQKKNLNINKNKERYDQRNPSRFTAAHPRLFNYNAPRVGKGFEDCDDVEDGISMAISYKENSGTLKGRKEQYNAVGGKDSYSDINDKMESFEGDSTDVSHGFSAVDIFAFLEENELDKPISSGTSDGTIENPMKATPIVSTQELSPITSTGSPSEAEVSPSVTISSSVVPTLPTNTSDSSPSVESAILSPLPVPIYSCKVCQKPLFAFVKGLLSDSSFGLNAHLTGYPTFNSPIKESAVVLRKCHASSIITEENGDVDGSKMEKERENTRNCYRLETFVPSQPELLGELQRKYSPLVKGAKKGSLIKKEYKRKIKINVKDRRVAERSAGDKQYSGHCGGCGVFVCVVVGHGKGNRHPLYRVNPKAVTCSLKDVKEIL